MQVLKPVHQIKKMHDISLANCVATLSIAPHVCSVCGLDLKTNKFLQPFSKDRDAVQSPWVVAFEHEVEREWIMIETYETTEKGTKHYKTTCPMSFSNLSCGWSIHQDPSSFDFPDAASPEQLTLGISRMNLNYLLDVHAIREADCAVDLLLSDQRCCVSCFFLHIWFLKTTSQICKEAMLGHLWPFERASDVPEYRVFECVHKHTKPMYFGSLKSKKIQYSSSQVPEMELIGSPKPVICATHGWPSTSNIVYLGVVCTKPRQEQKGKQRNHVLEFIRIDF